MIEPEDEPEDLAALGREFIALVERSGYVAPALPREVYRDLGAALVLLNIGHAAAVEVYNTAAEKAQLPALALLSYRPFQVRFGDDTVMTIRNGTSASERLQ